MAAPKRARVGVHIDMTPMVDVAFLLLIFFMSTTQFKPPEEVEMVLPSSHSEIKLPESDVLIVTVDKKNQVFLKLGSSGVQQSASLGNLEQDVVQARIRNPKLRLAIKSDKEADFGTIKDLMDLLQRTGNTRFNLVTLLEEDRAPVPAE